MKFVFVVLFFGTVLSEINGLCYDHWSHCSEYNKDSPECQENDFVKYKCKETCGLCGGPPKPPVTYPPVNTEEPPQSPPPPGSCGVRPNTRIVGGTKASPGDWPWQAMLRTTRGSSFCGGTLVAQQWVVTASHCVSRKRLRDLRVRMGGHKKRGDEDHNQDFEVERIIMHESYKRPYGMSHDIALLKLSTPAKMNKYVGLACLPYTTTQIQSGKRCWITGWGALASGGSSPRVLMQAEVPVVSKETCLRSYPSRIHDSMICAGKQEGGVDTCQGDSGGPLVCEFGGTWYLEGATSWGYRCASPGYYGVYANVRYLLSWIKGKINQY